MGIVVNLKDDILAQMMNEFHRQYDIAQTSERKAHNARLTAANLLKKMKSIVEGRGDDWWAWFETNSVRSRKDAERLLDISEADDPEAALEEEQERVRNAVSRLRNREKEFPIERIKKLIGKLTDKQRQELGAWFRSEYYL